MFLILYDALACPAVSVLLLDPMVGGFQPFLERQVWLPTQDGFDHGIVAVAPGYAARRVQHVLALKLDSGDLLIRLATS